MLVFRFWQIGTRWKPLGFALLAVYWFNPVLWLAYTLLCRDIELACDERVIRTMDESAVKTYSTVLLACSIPRKAVITCPLASSMSRQSSA